MHSILPVKVAIIGCGLIGTQWDAHSISTKYSLTHAAGFSRHPQAKLVAVCDQDIRKAQRAAQSWGVAHTYTDPQIMFAAGPIDIAIVASSSTARWDVIDPALASGVKVLVIEKPLSISIDESKNIASAVNTSNVKSLVNYSRRWDPSMRHLQAQIAAGDFGDIQRLVGMYGKGIANNGSHMIDLTALLCNARPIRARALGSPLAASESDWSKSMDLSLDAQFEFMDASGKSFQLTMLGTDQNAFTCFELRVFGTRVIVDIALGGRKITLTPTCNDPQYSGYTIPGMPESQESRALEAMDLMVDEAVGLARGSREQSSCDVNVALQTAMAIDALLCSAREHGRWVEIA